MGLPVTTPGSRSRTPAGGTRGVGIRRLAILGLAMVLAGPSASAPDPRPLAVDHAASSVVAVTGIAGLLSFLGHRHAILATEWAADLVYDPDTPDRSHLELGVPVHALRIDSRPAIEQAGLDARPDDETVRELQAKMLGPGMLDAGRFPVIRFESRSVERAPDGGLLVRGTLALHGRTTDHAVPVTVERRADGAYRFRGQLSVKQSDHGIEPESVAAVVKVADAVTIRFDVVAR